nr:hypothetical protein CFP56_64699 [Quercus suber]
MGPVRKSFTGQTSVVGEWLALYLSGAALSYNVSSLLIIDPPECNAVSLRCMASLTQILSKDIVQRSGTTKTPARKGLSFDSLLIIYTPKDNTIEMGGIVYTDSINKRVVTIEDPETSSEGELSFALLRCSNVDAENLVFQFYLKW